MWKLGGRKKKNLSENFNIVEWLVSSVDSASRACRRFDLLTSNFFLSFSNEKENIMLRLLFERQVGVDLIFNSTCLKQLCVYFSERTVNCTDLTTY